MRPELQDSLFQRYPLIFAEPNLPMKQTCMRWGIACGDGWFDLLDTLCEGLQSGTDRNQASQLVAAQVKEKFGKLRFYARGARQDQCGMIAMAEAMSARICDQCGKPGQTVVHGGCHMTRCGEHSPEGSITQEAFIAQRSARYGNT
jgi:hypothetical protein